MPLFDDNPSQETSTPVAHSPPTPDVHDVDSPQPTTSKAIDERLLHFEDEEISNMLKLMRKRKKARQEQLPPHHLHLDTQLKRPPREKN